MPQKSFFQFFSQKTIVAVFAISLSVFSGASYSSALSCTDIKVNLLRRNESSSVLDLQNFLSEKGFLTATPNGYFGPGTLKAVQEYQKSKKLPPTGSVYSLTRASIKADSCTASTSTTAPLMPTQKGNSGNPATSTAATDSTPISIEYRPVINSISKGTIFRHGQTSWALVLTGSNFATTTSNTVYLDDQKTGKRYTVGTFVSGDGKTITLPQSLGNIALACGTSCKEILNTGAYYVIVKTSKGGESQSSEAQLITVREANIGNAVPPSNPIPYMATGTSLGSFTFTIYNPVTISSINLNSTSTQFASTTLGKIKLKDEISGTFLPNNASGVSLYEGQYVNIGAYTNVLTEATSPKTAQMSFTLSVTDTYNKVTSFTTSPFNVTFDKEPSEVTLAKGTTVPPTIDAMDTATIFTNGTTDWALTLTGRSFDTASNTIYFTSRSNQRKYKIGIFPSLNGVIVLPKSLGKLIVNCGTGCDETLPPGAYDVTVSTKGGESNAKSIQVKSFNISSITGTPYGPLHLKVNAAKLGTVSFGIGAPLQVVAINPQTVFTAGASTFSNIVIKDESTGQPVSASLSKPMMFSENDSRVYGIYADVSTRTSGNANITLTLDVMDYIGNKHTLITSPPFMVSFTTDP